MFYRRFFTARQFAFWAGVFGITALGFGQSTASIKGTVVDQTGAAIPGVRIVLTQTELGINREGMADETGVYQFLQMPPGPYQLKAEKQGFASLVKTGIVLQVNTPATYNITMELGNVSETVSVEASVAQVNTTDASIGNAFTQTQVRQLPLLTRNVVELLSLQPGVTASGQVLGGRNDQNNVTLDGVDVNDNQSPGAFESVLPVPLDSVQEFRVTVGGQGASQGRSSGGQVALVTKSGSNAFHGSAYEFHRNTVTAANNWFNNRAGVKREQLIRNQFGASLGGPIIRDRVFFFFNYEQRIDASSAAQTRTVPTETFKQGIIRARLSNGTIASLSPDEIRRIDSRGIGISPAMISLLRQYPAGNDPNLGSDRGLNFMGLRFNAPFRLDNKAYVGKMDFKLDGSGNHTLALRGTLADNAVDQALAQMPGQDPASKLLNNSRGFSSMYTAVLKTNLVNALNVGLTRQGIAQSGVSGTALVFGPISNLLNYTRASGRIVPVWNITDDLTWTKGRHTVTTGINFRFVRNDRFSYGSAYPTFGMSRGTMLGLGSDINVGVRDYLRQREGIANLTLSQPNPVIDAMGTLLGMLTYRTLTYQFGRDGTALPIGSPLARSFGTNEYEFYVADSWRVVPSLTLTFGLRYGNYQPPYERNGIQVNTTFPLDAYFAERNYLSQQGVASNAMPNARLKYDFSGPGNGGDSWFRRDNNNWAPRFSFAWSPASGSSGNSWLARAFGKNGVLRGGAAMVYDRFGSDMIVNFDSLGSVGLATPFPFDRSYNMADSPRYTGAFPALPTPPTATFPFQPPDVVAVAGTFLGIYPSLVSPYSFILNLNYSRELPGGMILDMGYAGRLGRKQLLQGDIYTPLNYKDPKSGTTWLQMANQTRSLFEGGLSPEAVSRNPSLMPLIPFIENVWPGLRNYYFPGSASANYFHHIYVENEGSDLDGLHLLDRVRSFGGGNCLSLPGCHTFFALQGSAMPTWMNAGRSNFHGAVLTVRRPLTRGWGFDFNYTWSHSIDNGSAAESGAGQFGGVLQSVYFPQANRGSSDFDIRHNVNANAVVDLPIGKGKALLGGIPTALDHIIGGWQVSSLMRFRTGLPFNVSGTGIWNTNYWIGSRAEPFKPFENRIGFNQNGNPSLFPNTNAAASFRDQFPGTVGQRAVVRGDVLLNFDMAVAKFFKLPWGPSDSPHQLQFRGEAFNLFNHVNFASPSLALSAAATFGEFTATATSPRVLQFALRYEF